MSTENLQKIIGRLVTEAYFRELLFTDPDKALEGYALTPEETGILKGIKREKVEGVVSEVEQRISKSAFLAFLERDSRVRRDIFNRCTDPDYITPINLPDIV